MKETLEFALRVFLKQGMWIVGAAWMLAVGSRAIYGRGDRRGGSKDDAPAAVRWKIILGAAVVIIGILIAYVPLP